MPCYFIQLLVYLECRNNDSIIDMVTRKVWRYIRDYGIRSCNSNKDRQYNGQKKKRQTIGWQNTTQKTKDWETQTHENKNGVNSVKSYKNN